MSGPLIHVKKPITKNNTPTMISGLVLLSRVGEAAGLDMFIYPLRAEIVVNDKAHIQVHFEKPSHNIHVLIIETQHHDRPRSYRKSVVVMQRR